MTSTTFSMTGNVKRVLKFGRELARLSQGYLVSCWLLRGDAVLIFAKVVLLYGQTVMRKLLRRYSWVLLLELTLVINVD